MLGRDVSCRAGLGNDSRDRGGIDNGPFARANHFAQLILHAQKDAAQIYGDEAIEGCRIELPGELVIGVLGRDSRIV
jgi:hypothetical protein